jgi:hypothetical protein
MLAILIAVLATQSGEVPAPATSSAEVSIDYQRDPGAEACPDAATFRQAVALRLARPVGSSASAALRLRVELEFDEAEGIYRGKVLRLDTAEKAFGQRLLVSRSKACEPLATALILVVSSVAEASLPELEPVRAEAAPSPLPPPPAQPAPQVQLQTRHAAWLVPAVELLGGLQGSLGAGLGPTLGFKLGAEARWRRFSLDLEGRVDLPTLENPLPDSQIQAWLLAGEVAPCFRQWFLGVCGLGVVGVERGESTGLYHSSSTTTPYLALGGALLAELPLNDLLRLRLEAELIAPLISTVFEVSDRQVWTTPSVEGGLTLELAVRL